MQAIWKRVGGAPSAFLAGDAAASLAAAPAAEATPNRNNIRRSTPRRLMNGIADMIHFLQNKLQERERSSLLSGTNAMSDH
jgi:hypothetical protein